MRAAVDLQAVTDRVLGMPPTRAEMRAHRAPRGDMIYAMAMLFTSAAGSAGVLGLWTTGHGVAGLRLFCGAVLLLLILLRLR